MNPRLSVSTSVLSGIRDNYRRGSVGDYLRQNIQVDSDLSIVSAYFTIYAFEALKQPLSDVRRLRFLFGEPRFLQALDPDTTDKKTFRIEDDELHLTNRNKILQHNGCIIADSVGLGKTYEALAVIKYFELRNDKVLVLCPKKLRENWTVYQAQNNSELNPFVNDRFGYTVLSHTDLSRESGRSGDIDLQAVNWGNYDLVVIDESHNFRNNTRGRRDEDGNVIVKSRYERMMDDVLKSGVRTKVLLLSATPVNNTLQDLRNQIYLLGEGDDAAFSKSIGITSVRDTLTAAQRTFTEWASDAHGERKASVLLEKLSAAFFTLLDELTIARSRKHIVKYYADTLQALGPFPERRKPISIFPDIDLRGRFMSYDKLNDEISNYRLSLFSPSQYLKPEFIERYENRQVRNFKQSDREHFLIGMMKVNFLKRLESSVNSFALSMDRTINKIKRLEEKIIAFQQYRDANLALDWDEFSATEFNRILTNFSPVAKRRAKMKSMPQDDEIDLLIATDCISEGQNLQDCDYLVNYDIHWNPVRLIQRFGRIDRIGSVNTAIQMVNFWPTDDLNRYINLKNRVEARMTLVDITATGQDDFLNTQEIQELIKEDLTYRDQQLLRLKEEVLDMEDLNESVTLNEFTLDDFRIELSKYIESNKDKLKDAPMGLYAVVPPNPEVSVIGPGVIFCLRQKGDTSGNETVNPLQPYFLVYVRDTGDMRYNFTHPKQILEIFRVTCSGKSVPYEVLCSLFDRKTDNGADMGAYSRLLNRAVEAITGVFRRKNASGLTSGRGGVLIDSGKQVKGTSDFELISWLVIQEAK